MNSPGRRQKFSDKVELILSGSEPDAMQLMMFGENVRRTGGPVIWIHHPQDVPNFPFIGLVAMAGDQLSRSRTACSGSREKPIGQS